MCGNAELPLLFLFTSPCQGVVLGAEPPSLHHLYLLHPAFPLILLDLANATGTVTASKGQSRGQWESVYAYGGEDVLAVCEGTTVLPGEGCVLSDDSRGCVLSRPRFPWGLWCPEPWPECSPLHMLQAQRNVQSHSQRV